MKKTITATCQKSGNPIVSRHCFEHNVEKATSSVKTEAMRLTDNEVKISVTNKIEF